MKNKVPPEILQQEIPKNSVLMKYISNAMNEPQKRELEEWFSEDIMLGDAIEGLKQIENADELNKINDSLSAIIDKKIRKKKRKILNPIRFPLWLTLLITTILLAILVGYALIKMLDN
jgi:hypothetical protein